MNKLPYTPNSRLRSSLRMLFLRSRERASAIKRDKYTCQKCGTKQSRAKGKEAYVEVHHKFGIDNWPKLFKAVRKYLLCEPKLLETLCKECHEKTEEGAVVEISGIKIIGQTTKKVEVHR